MNETEIKKSKKIIHIGIAVFTLVIMVLSGFIYGESTIFTASKIPVNNALLVFIFVNIPTLITTFFVIAGAWYINILIHFLLHKSFNSSKRGETILTMLYSFTKYIIAIIAILVILTLWGVNSSALLASAGGLALVVGLGAQSLISDVITGVFIVFEGEFNVGDIVVIDNWRGKVLSIGIRSTRFIDIYGDVKTINNSQITTVVNKTKELSLASVTVGINYGESLIKVETIIKNEINNIKKRIPEAQEHVKYMGVAELNASSVDLLFATYCKEEHVMVVKRKINREIKLMFDRNNIEIPYQHITLEYKKDIPKEDFIDTDDIEPIQNGSDDIDFENLLINKEVVVESVINDKQVTKAEKFKPQKPKKQKKVKESNESLREIKDDLIDRMGQIQVDDDDTEDIVLQSEDK